ncbi:MAG: ATP-binding protein [Chloroflexota bacterium]
MTETSTSKGDTDTSSNAERRPEANHDSQNVCPVCRGVGFVHPAGPSGAPDFSRVTPCTCRRNELSRQKQGLLQRYSNLGYLAHYTFESLSPRGRSGTAAEYQRAYEAAQRFADCPSGWLVLIGPVGSGKTHLSCAIANALLSSGRPVFYVGAADLLDHLRATFSPGSEIRYDELFEQVKNAPLLVLDDIQGEVGSNWARQKLEQIFSHRFNCGLPTVVTTDIPPDGLAERVSERLIDPDFCSVLVLGDLRGGVDMPGLPEGLRTERFDNFEFRRVELSREEQQNLEMAFTLANEFAQQPEGWLVFQGRNGCGKTHLAAAIANYRLERNEPVLFLVVSDLLDYLRAAFGPESRVSYARFFDEVKQSPLLILDDFGEQSATPWAKSKLFQLLNHRYNSRLPTVITTSLTLDDIETRMVARLADPRIGTVFNIMAPHYNVDVDERRGDGRN